MKSLKASPFHILLFLMVLLVCLPSAYADPSGGGAAAMSVAKTVHKAAQVQTLTREFNQVMSQYQAARDEASRNEMLIKAKNILAQLVEQANNVESEISMLSKKQLDAAYARKLDRVLSNVQQMKAASEKKMQSTGQAG